MNQDKEESQINVNVPARTKELAKKKLDHGGLSRVIRERLEQIAYGEETSKKEQLKDHLRELQQDREQLKHKRQEIDNRLSELQTEINRIEDKLDDVRDKEGEYEGALSQLDETLENGGNVFPEHAQVKRAAEIGNCSVEDVMEDMRERHSDLPENRFQDRMLQ